MCLDVGVPRSSCGKLDRSAACFHIRPFPLGRIAQRKLVHPNDNRKANDLAYTIPSGHDRVHTILWAGSFVGPSVGQSFFESGTSKAIFHITARAKYLHR